MSLGKKTVQGLFWTYAAIGGSKLLNFVSTVILMNLLAPEFFGQVALAALAATYLDAIGDLGIAAALIYQKDNVERASRVAFAISIGMGLVLWAAGMLTAPAVGAYFGEPAIVPMFRVLAFTFFIQSLGNVHSALLSKELKFRQKMAPELIRTLTKGVAGIALALLGFGAWSLVWGQVAAAIATTITVWIILPLRLRPLWDTVLGRSMMRYGVQVVTIELLAVLWSTADYIVIGKRLGNADLGLYRQAYVVTELLIVNMCYIAGRVLFPSFAKLNHNPEAIKRGFLITLRYIALITLPLTVGLMVVAPVFVAVMFDDKWQPMTPALQWLALRAGLSALFFNAGHVYKAIGKPSIINKQMVVKLAALVAAVLLTVQFGFVAVAMGQVGAGLLGLLIDVGTVIYVLDVPLQEIWRQIRPACFSAVGMGLIVWGFLALLAQAQPIISMTIGVTIGALSYIGLMWLTDRQLVVESVRILEQIVRPKRGAPVVEH